MASSFGEALAALTTRRGSKSSVWMLMAHYRHRLAACLMR
jgi:hypothetical protein